MRIASELPAATPVGFLVIQISSIDPLIGPAITGHGYLEHTSPSGASCRSAGSLTPRLKVFCLVDEGALPSLTSLSASIRPRTIDRVTIGVMTASLVIGSSIVMTVPGGPIVFGVSLLALLGLLGYLMAFVNSLWVVISIWRSGRR